ncbi:hypothetical protein OAO54_06595 [Amylibacter sp.]|nr:hypothetical protein [Amylibacter sp.]
MNKSTANIIVMPSPPSLIGRSVEKAKYSQTEKLFFNKGSNKEKDEIMADLSSNFFNEPRVKFITLDMLGLYTSSLKSTESWPYSLDGSHLSLYGSREHALDYLRSTSQDVFFGLF